MATSGTYTDIANNLEIVKAALRKINRLGDHETFADTDNRYTAAVAALKVACKEMVGFGMPLWAIDELSIACSNFTTASGITIGLSGCTVTNVAPLKVLQVILRDSTNASYPQDTELTLDEQSIYLNRPSKSDTGTPGFYAYYPQGPAASSNAARGTLKIWPLPDSDWQTNGTVIVRHQRPFQDVGTSTQHLDFPQEWQKAVIYSLAYDLSSEYGVDPTQRQALKSDRDEALGRALSFGTEEGSFRIQPRKS